MRLTAVVLLLSLCGACTSIEMRLSPPDLGMFLKPMGHLKSSSPPTQRKDAVMILRPTSTASIEGHLGSFTQPRPLESKFLQPAEDDPWTNRVVIEPLGLTAHVVNRNISRTSPRLQVLFHAPHHSRWSVEQYCARVYVAQGQHEVVGSCLLSMTGSDDYTCLAEPVLPLDWWRGSRRLSVSYSASAGGQCHQPRAHLPEILNRPVKPSGRHTLYPVYLLDDEEKVMRINPHEKSELHVLMPDRKLQVGDQFRVRLQTTCTQCRQIRVTLRAKNLEVLSAEVGDNTSWYKSSLYSQKQSQVELVRLTNRHNTNWETSDLMTYTMYIGDDANKAGSVSFTIIAVIQMADSDVSEERRMIVRPMFSSKHISTQLLPVVKHTELVNTAVLSGRPVIEPLYVYAVSADGRVESVRHRTSCYSTDENVLKVDIKCGNIRLVGSEDRGAGNVSLIAKYEKQTRYIHLRVWYPEKPLDFWLSSNTLSAVKNWNVSSHQTDRQTNRLPSQQCHQNYQRAEVKVFSRFYFADADYRIYLSSKKALFEITDFVDEFLSVRDSNIARIENRHLVAISPGRTSITLGKDMGSLAVRVADSTSLRSLNVNLCSFLGLSVIKSASFPRSLTVESQCLSTLKPSQTAEIHVQLKYDDDTTIDLSSLPPESYDLHLTAARPSVLAPLGHLSSKDHLPLIVARSPGKGPLIFVGLGVPHTCSSNDNLLVSQHVNIEVEGLFVESADAPTDWRKTVIIASDGVRSDNTEETGTSANSLAPVTASTNGISGLELGMYVLLAVFATAIAVFSVYCAVFCTRYRKSGRYSRAALNASTPDQPKETLQPSYAAREWVWLGQRSDMPLYSTADGPTEPEEALYMSAGPPNEVYPPYSESVCVHGQALDSSMNRGRQLPELPPFNSTGSSHTCSSGSSHPVVNPYHTRTIASQNSRQLPYREHSNSQPNSSFCSDERDHIPPRPLSRPPCEVQLPQAELAYRTPEFHDEPEREQMLPPYIQNSVLTPDTNSSYNQLRNYFGQMQACPTT